jgi:hypothetical protein
VVGRSPRFSTDLSLVVGSCTRVVRMLCGQGVMCNATGHLSYAWVGPDHQGSWSRLIHTRTRGTAVPPDALQWHIRGSPSGTEVQADTLTSAAPSSPVGFQKSAFASDLRDQCARPSGHGQALCRCTCCI